MRYHLTPAESGSYANPDGTRHRFLYVELRNADFDIISEQHYTQDGDAAPWRDAGQESGDPDESIPALVAPHCPDLLAHIADLYHMRTTAITINLPA